MKVINIVRMVETRSLMVRRQTFWYVQSEKKTLDNILIYIVHTNLEKNVYTELASNTVNIMLQV